MGKDAEGQPPKKPGFMVIGTQNPITMAGRRAPSTALARRMCTIALPPYPKDEMLQILLQKGVQESKAKVLVDVYQERLDYASKHHKEPMPTFRDLLKLSEAMMIGAKKATVAPFTRPELMIEDKHTEVYPLNEFIDFLATHTDKDVILKKSKDMNIKKEQVLAYIKALAEPERTLLIKGIFNKEKEGLYTFFSIQCGFRATAENRGSFKELAEVVAPALKTLGYFAQTTKAYRQAIVDAKIANPEQAPEKSSTMSTKKS